MRVREPMVADEQWAEIGPLMPKPKRNPKGVRPWADDRLVFKGMLDWDGVFVDASFSPAKRSTGVGRIKRGKGSSVPATARWQRCSSRKPYRRCLAG